MKKTFCILFAVLGLTVVSCNNDKGSHDFLMSPELPELKEKREKIETEISQLKDHPWAGRYHFNNGHDTQELVLAPENGFILTFSWHFDADFHSGTVDWDGSNVKLVVDDFQGSTINWATNSVEIISVPLDDNSPAGRRPIHTEYKPIRWGERLYLIPASEIIDFCHTINMGYEPRSGERLGNHLLRRGDSEKEAKGKPEIPEEFMSHLLDEPVDAILVSVTTDPASRWPNNGIATVVLNKGKKDGLLPGMMLIAEHCNEIYWYTSVELTEVDETQSKGKMHYSNLPSGGRKHPDIGHQFSTRPKWMRRSQSE